MKKLMIAAAIVCAAAFAEAASATWNVTALYIPTKDNLTPGTSAGGSKFAKDTTYSNLVIDFFYQDQTSLEWVKLDSTSSMSAATDGMTTKTEFWTDDSAAYKALIDNTSINFKTEITYTTADGTYTTSGTVTKNFENLPNSAQSATISMNNKTWTFTVVPEPTSGLLLLLGVAGLALRRRRA